MFVLINRACKELLFFLLLYLSALNFISGPAFGCGSFRDPDNRWMTPAMSAAYYGDVEKLKALLEGGENANAAGPGGTTLLMLAAMSPSDGTEAVYALLKHGARFDAEDINGTDALTIARSRNKIETAAVIEAAYRSRLAGSMLFAAGLLTALIVIRRTRMKKR